MTTDCVLEASDLAIHYGGVKAVDGVDLTLRRGQIRGLIGPNGAGKSTVVDAITGRSRLTRGRLSLGGEDVTGLDVVERRRRGLSRSFQRTSVFPEMLVRKQVELSARLMKASGPVADADDVLDELDLLELGGVQAAELGYGEQRRLDLALALVGRPSVLLLDEPMAGLSMRESADLAQHLKSLATRRNVSVLLIEHDVETVFGISDDITVLELGRVIAAGTPDDVRRDARVREAYLGTAA